MKILYMGNKKRGHACLKALLRNNEEIVEVVVPPENNALLKRFAKGKGFDVYEPADINAPDAVHALQAFSPDLIVMARYNQILGEKILSIPEKGVLNLHAGKLPEYRGASTLNWTLINGEDEGGVSVVLVDENIDTGDILAQKTFPIEQDDTIKDVEAKANDIFPSMLIDTLEQIKEGTIERTPQSPDEGSYYPRREPSDGEINWKIHTARRVHNLVRALTHPYSGAFTHYEGDKLFIWSASLPENEIDAEPGRVSECQSDGVIVGTANKGILLEKVQLEGGREQKANELFESPGAELG